MRRTITTALLATAVLSIGATARAGKFWDSCKLTFHRNVAWPQPFTQPDQMSVMAPFCAMIDKGWRLQNTLGPQHFEVDNQSLNQAGLLKVQWILTHAQPSRRAIFVERGATPEQTVTRMAAVQNAAQGSATAGAEVLVYESSLPAPTRGGNYTRDINTRFQSGLPAPVLPSSSGGGSGGSQSTQ